MAGLDATSANGRKVYDELHPRIVDGLKRSYRLDLYIRNGGLVREPLVHVPTPDANGA